MKYIRKLSLILLLGLVGCVPAALNPKTEVPAGYSLTVTPGILTQIRLQVGAPVQSAQLVINGRELKTGADECTSRPDGRLWCDFQPINRAVTIEVSGTVTVAAATVCTKKPECYAFRSK